MFQVPSSPMKVRLSCRWVKAQSRSRRGSTLTPIHAPVAPIPAWPMLSIPTQGTANRAESRRSLPSHGRISTVGADLRNSKAACDNPLNSIRGCRSYRLSVTSITTLCVIDPDVAVTVTGNVWDTAACVEVATVLLPLPQPETRTAVAMSMNAPISFRFLRVAKSSRMQLGNPATMTELVDAMVSMTVIADDGVTLAGKLQVSPCGSPEQLS